MKCYIKRCIICEGVDSEVLSLIYQTKMLPVLGCARTLIHVRFVIKKQTLSPSPSGKAVLCSRHAEQDPYRIPVGEAVHKLLRLFFHFDLHRLEMYR